MPINNQRRLFLCLMTLFVSFLIPQKVRAQDPNSPFAWVPYLSRRIQTPLGACIFNNLLWQWGTNNNVFGITAFDGQINYQGGKTVGMGINTFHPTGAGLYATVFAKRTLLQPKAISGKFQIAETLIQPASGATGVLVLLQPNLFTILTINKDFDTTPVRGVSSGAILDVQSVKNDTSYFLERSLTGFDDFVPVMDIPYRLKMRGLVDCGLITFGNKTKRLLLAFDDPIVDGQFAHVYYNFPEIDNNWSLLFTAEIPNSPRPIRHFHGAIWIPGTEQGKGRLIAMTGDGDTEASLLVCDDVADFINHPETWKTNWGLDRTGADRVNYLQNKGKPYCIGTGSQLYRVIDILLDPNGKDAYYIPDTHTLTYLMKIDLPNKTAKQIGTNPALGYGWTGLRLSNGQMLFGVASEHQGSSYTGRSDSYVRIYALKPDGSDIVEVHKTLRADYLKPDTTRGNFISIVEYDNALWLPSINVLEPVTVGTVVDKNKVTQTQNDEADNLANVLLKLSSTDILFGAGRFRDVDMPLWATWRASISSDTKVVQPNKSPSSPSMLLQPSSITPGLSAATLYLNPKIVSRIRGKWITSVVYVHTEQPNQDVSASIYFDGNRGIQTNLKTTGGWDMMTVTAFVPYNAQGLAYNLVGRLNGTLTRKVWFANSYIMIGALPR